jgi:hypothetical protein
LNGLPPPLVVIEMEIPTDGSVIAHKDDKYVVVLPCFGAPYLFGIYGHKGYKGKEGSNLELLQKAVMGRIEPYDRKGFVIHPMFCEENPRWAMAQRLLYCRWTKVYVNENGGEACAVNAGTFEVLCPYIGAMVLHKNPATSGEGESGVWEFEDEEDEAKHIAEFKQKGYDFNEHNGFCYKRPIVGIVPPVVIADMD